MFEGSWSARTPRWELLHIKIKIKNIVRFNFFSPITFKIRKNTSDLKHAQEQMDIDKTHLRVLNRRRQWFLDNRACAGRDDAEDIFVFLNSLLARNDVTREIKGEAMKLIQYGQIHEMVNNEAELALDWLGNGRERINIGPNAGP